VELYGADRLFDVYLDTHGAKGVISSQASVKLNVIAGGDDVGRKAICFRVQLLCLSFLRAYGAL
jgi:hypothetical protein